MKKLVFILCSSMVVASAPAQQPDFTDQSMHAIRLFEEACFKNSGEPKKIRAWARAAVLLEIGDESAKTFLNGNPGRAWSATNAIGTFAISSSDNGICTVYARKVKPSALKELYLAFLPKPGSNMVVEKKTDGVRQTPQGDLNTLGHEITREGAPFKIATVLSTSESDQAPMQAVISLAVSAR